jgi:hypothetical protein
MKKQKTYTTEQAMARIKKNLKKPRPVVNVHLKKYLHGIVNKELGKKFRSEGMKILMKAKREEVAEFLYAYHSDYTGCGLCCIALDFIKDRLVKDKEVGKSFGNKFGNNF